MAPVSTLFSSHLRSSIPYDSSRSTQIKADTKPVALFRCENERIRSSQSVADQGPFLPKSNHFRRREVLTFQLATLFTFSPLPQIISQALASAHNLNDHDPEEGFRLYTDDANKFKLLIPREWQVGVGEPGGFKSVTAFYPQETSTSNVSVVITGLGADFTRMESFGKVEAFADTLVSGLDRSWQRPPGVAAKLIDCKATKGFYYIEYSLQNPGESCRHLLSVIGMASNGWYNRLYTVTGQFLEEDSEKYSSKIEKAVSSFSFI